MKKWTSFIILSISVLIVAAPLYSGAKSAFVAGRDPAPAWTNETLAAHALGSVDNHFYTNSYEAFQQNYDKGYRLFEVDLQLTTDGYLISRHDWGSYLYDRFRQELPRPEMGKPTSRKTILDLPILERYHAMSFEQICDLMRKHPDMWIITDTKGSTAEEAQASFRALMRASGSDTEVLSRIIPQIYSQEMYGWIEQVHSFSSYIYTLYQSPDSDNQVLDFVRRTESIDAVTMPEERAGKSVKLVQQLATLQVPVYVHTVNDLEAIRSLLATGVHGVYSDSMTYARMAAAGISVPKVK
ncbi:phosphatidylinositol-specific phospholipase C/glycerophosphodiester phosphodiesterase family protein [Paenibacillus sp. D51F]